MEEHKSFSVSRTYVPNEYRVYPLARVTASGSRTTRRRWRPSLAGYLLEHARRERLALLSSR